MSSVQSQSNSQLVDAFLRREPEIFRSVAYPTEVWKEDLCDVETIHGEARELFDRLLTQAVDPLSTAKIGRMLLLLGEAGAGKTHLMRAFRTRTHSGGAGYFGYMQMTSSASNYGRYVLRMLIESLQKPYSPRLNDDHPRGLKRLSNVLAERKGGDAALLKKLRTEDLSADDQSRVVRELQIQITNRSLRDTPPDLVRAMLFLQTEDAHAHGLVMKYLRAESLSEHDQQYLAGITPLDSEEDAVAMILGLGKLMWDLQKAALVICVDQIEDMLMDPTASQETQARFLRALMTLREIAERLPSAIVIISCLEDFYLQFSESLPRPLQSRLKTNPEPITLVAERSRGEVDEMVAAHLAQLVDEDEEACLHGTDPVPEEILSSATGKRSREVLDLCRRYRDRCLRAGYLVTPDDTTPPPNDEHPGVDPHVIKIESEWNDFLAAWETERAADEADLICLLEATVQSVSTEHSGKFRFDTEANQTWLTIAADSHDMRRQVGICNKSSRGGGLTNQVRKLRAAAEQLVPEATPIIVRTTDYRPTNPRTKIAQEYAAVVQSGGFALTIDDSDWRKMAAFQAFAVTRKSEQHFGTWLTTMQPLTRMASMQILLALDRIPTSDPDDDAPAPEKVTTASPTKPPRNEVAISTPDKSDSRNKQDKPTVPEVSIGVTLQDQEVTADTESFKRHAGFLGGTGSGKTTAALNILEQVLLEGIPVLLIDRKGDLAAFADPAMWDRETDDDNLLARGAGLRDAVKVSLYTPGQNDGHPLALSIVPDRIQDVPEGERQIICRNAADALGRIMGYGNSKTARSRISVLIKAIEILAARGTTLSLETLIQLTYNPDVELISALGVLDPKNCEKVAEDLQMLRINNQHLFPDNCETLDAETLFAPRNGQTHLSIISTKFLGSDDNVEFWIAQLLFELNRWCSRTPSDKLQAVVMFDEADLYLPATSKPATKEPMEGLLKRARSAGLGVFLATQSPGDLDYKCRDNIYTWMIGNVRQQRAIDKLKPLLGGLKIDIGKQLQSQQTGEFFLAQGDGVQSLRSHRSFMETTQLSEVEILKLAQRSCEESQHNTADA